MMDDERYKSQVQRQLSETKASEPDVILIGDSIIQGMQNYQIWDEWMSPFHPLNLGIGGDRVEATLKRIQNNEYLTSLNPVVVVLHVGTNNMGDSAENIAEKICKVVEIIASKFPRTNIIVWGLLPRGETPNVLWKRNERVNILLSDMLSKTESAELINTFDVLIDSENKINKSHMHDFLHLTDVGYRLAFRPVYERILSIMSPK